MQTRAKLELRLKVGPTKPDPSRPDQNSTGQDAGGGLTRTDEEELEEHGGAWEEELPSAAQ
ncbi:GM12605 [Drosophila sechellia]|uniref:GM12605 n=1 Tax=Drosophila sechellia TaxID=7238 RepID=B4ILF3_DROSE|nr:GM12605 [Drosophila sechellia]